VEAKQERVAQAPEIDPCQCELDQDGRQVLAISSWDSKESAEKYNRETYPQVLKTLARVIEGTPQVRTYEVAFSTAHKTAAI